MPCCGTQSTASKIERPVNEMTHSVTVISEEQIKEQGFTDLTEILRQGSWGL